MEDTTKKLQIDCIETMMVTYDIAITPIMLAEFKRHGLDINSEDDLPEIIDIIKENGDWHNISSECVEMFIRDETILDDD